MECSHPLCHSPFVICPTFSAEMYSDSWVSFTAAALYYFRLILSFSPHSSFYFSLGLQLQHPLMSPFSPQPLIKCPRSVSNVEEDWNSLPVTCVLYASLEGWFNIYSQTLERRGLKRLEMFQIPSSVTHWPRLAALQHTIHQKSTTFRQNIWQMLCQCRYKNTFIIYTYLSAKRTKHQSEQLWIWKALLCICYVSFFLAS